jgi:hypothetical protein
MLTQRKAGNSATLRPDRRMRLEAIGFVWKNSRPKGRERWERRFAQLCEFRNRFGHCYVPAKWGEDKAFGGWVHNQRAFKKKGTLSEERAARLEGVGFAWQQRFGAPSREAHWDQMLARLDQFQQQHGHTEIPPGDPDTADLRRWMLNQREAGNSGTLRPDRRARLEAIRFVWKDSRREDRARWERRFAQLLEFRARFGHTRVAAKWREDIPFGTWVHNQRAFKRKGILSAERIRRLDEIGFTWEG